MTQEQKDRIVASMASEHEVSEHEVSISVLTSWREGEGVECFRVHTSLGGFNTFRFFEGHMYMSYREDWTWCR